MTQDESNAVTKVPCPMCIPDDVRPGLGVHSCQLCGGDGMVMPYVRILFHNRKMSGEYHHVRKP